MKEFIRRIIPPFLLDWYHFILAFLAAIFYWFPSKKLKVIGITGTNGKSTVVEMTAKILAEAGYKVASLSSIKFKIGNQEWLNTLRMTMPGRFKIQRFLRQAVDSGCQYAILEVTSEGIKQHRHEFVDFEAAVFTNLTPEHIEAHGSFEKYREAKGKFFQVTKNIHVLNLGNEQVEYFLKFPAKEKWGYEIKSKVKNQKLKLQFKSKNLLVAEGCQVLPQGLKFLVNNTEFNLKLLGEFNIYNALAAIGVGLSQGVNLKTCKSALEKIELIPGRMELVISHPFKVFVDYAFTPNALEKVYQTLTMENYRIKTGRLICVLGATGGGRDKWKRPALGKLAAKYCDEVLVTNEDPYDEDPMAIIEQVAKGTEGKGIKILDRKIAIRGALKSARVGDTVIITGKGCEPSICLAGGKKIPWDDRKVVQEEFKKLPNKLDR